MTKIHWKGLGGFTCFFKALLIVSLSCQCLSQTTTSTRSMAQEIGKQVADLERQMASSTTVMSMPISFNDELFETTSTKPSKEILKQFQYYTRRVNEFCKHYNHSSEMPEDRAELNGLLHHLLYDDSKRIIFCYVPKAGCSNWKRMFAVLNGTEQATNTERPHDEVLKNVNKLQHLLVTQQKERFDTYFKFTFIRNPLERIVSAYRNKIAIPIKHEKHWPYDVLNHIVETYNKDQYDKWKQTNFASTYLHPSFEEFVKYLIDSDLISLNEHFRPFMNLGHPCSVRYNYIGNFNNLPNEAFYILDFLGIPRNYYLNRAGHPKYNTSSLVADYYKRLPNSLKFGLVEKFSQELILYYFLFPADLEKDKEFL